MPWSRNAIRNEDGFCQCFVERQPERKWGGARVGNSEQLIHRGYIHFELRLAENSFAAIEDHFRPVLRKKGAEPLRLIIRAENTNLMPLLAERLSNRAHLNQHTEFRGIDEIR